MGIANKSYSLGVYSHSCCGSVALVLPNSYQYQERGSLIHLCGLRSDHEDVYCSVPIILDYFICSSYSSRGQCSTYVSTVYRLRHLPNSLVYIIINNIMCAISRACCMLILLLLKAKVTNFIDA